MRISDWSSDVCSSDLPAVLTIAKIEAGTTHNIIPGEAKLLGTLRTLSEETRANTQAAFRRIVTHIAAAHGCAGEAVIDKGYPVTMNDARATAMLKDIAGDTRSDASRVGHEWVSTGRSRWGQA